MKDKVMELRQKTSIGVMQCRNALVEADWDVDKAVQVLKSQDLKIVEKRSDRETNKGIVDCYTHANRVGALVELNCETDFVARNPAFKDFAHELCLQVASMKPDNVDELLTQNFIRDGSKTIKDMVNDLIVTTGENIQIRRFERFEVGIV